MSNVNVNVTISGTFPKDDIALIADHYLLEGETDQDKIDAIVNALKEYIVEYLSAPSANAIRQSYTSSMIVDLDALKGRVESALTTSSQEV